MIGTFRPALCAFAAARQCSKTLHENAEIWPLPAVDLADVDVAISRTEPRFEDHPGVFEVRELHLDAIAAARTSIFAENQYFTSRTIARALRPAALRCRARRGRIATGGSAS